MAAMPPSIIRQFLGQSAELFERLDRDLARLRAGPTDASAADRIAGALAAVRTGAGFLDLKEFEAAAVAAGDALREARRAVGADYESALANLWAAIDSLKQRKSDIAITVGELPASSPESAFLPTPSSVVPQTWPTPSAASEPLEHQFVETGFVEARFVETRPVETESAESEFVESEFVGPECVEPECPAPEGPQHAPAAPEAITHTPAPFAPDASTEPALSPTEARVTPHADEHLKPQPDVVLNAATAPDRRPLLLSDTKSSLAEFMVQDLRETVAGCTTAVAAMMDAAGRARGASDLCRLSGDLTRLARFFEIDPIAALAAAMRRFAESAPTLPEDSLAQAHPRLLGALEVFRELADTLAVSTVMLRPVVGLAESLDILARAHALPPARTLPASADALTALETDGVVGHAAHAEPTPAFDTSTFLAPHDPSAEPSNAGAAPCIQPPTADAPPPCIDRAPETPAPMSEERATDAELSDMLATTGTAISPLDAAAGELGNLIVQSSRLAAIPAERPAPEIEPRLLSRIAHASDDLARAVGGVKRAVLGARALPASQLFASCVEAFQDTALTTITANITGGDAELDLAVIDRIRSPLATLLREAAAHVRASAPSPTLALHAQIDDQTDFAHLSISLFPGAPALTDLSIAALRIAVESIRGHVSLIHSDAATSLAIRVPTSLSFLNCTVIRIGATLAAVPMADIQEIIKPDADQVTRGPSGRVVLIRDGAAALLDGHDLFAAPDDPRVPAPYAVVLAQSGRRVALSCARVLGPQEVVVRPMDPMPRRAGPISGIAAAADGSPALIVDAPALLRMTAEQDATAALGLAA